MNKKHWLNKLVEEKGGVYRRYKDGDFIIHSATQHDEDLNTAEMLDFELENTPTKTRLNTDMLIIFRKPR